MPFELRDDSSGVADVGRPQKPVSVLLPRIAVGASAFHAGASPPRAATALFAALDAALERGATLVDLSPSYGRGEAEATVGRWLASRRCVDSMMLVTKVLPGARAEVTRQIESSLRRLRVDAIDVALVHSGHEAPELHREALEGLTALERDGLVGGVGMSTTDSDPNAVIPVVRDGLVRFVSLSYNVFDRSRAASLLECCCQRGMRVLARAPFLHGTLVGFFMNGSPLATDARGIVFTPSVRRAVNARFQEFRALARDLGMPVHELALRFVASESRIDTILVGMRTASHVQANANAVLAGALPETDLARLGPFDWPDRFSPRLGSVV